MTHSSPSTSSLGSVGSGFLHCIRCHIFVSTLTGTEGEQHCKSQCQPQQSSQPHPAAAHRGFSSSRSSLVSLPWLRCVGSTGSPTQCYLASSVYVPCSKIALRRQKGAQPYPQDTHWPRRLASRVASAGGQRCACHGDPCAVRADAI